MADELEKNLEGKPDRAEERIKELSGKVELTSKERDEYKTLKEKSEASAAEMQKERDFYQSFADVVAENPAAKEHKEEILQKVKSGYTVEDATSSVLIKAGKYTSPREQVVERPIVAGGSAPTNVAVSGDRRISEMSRDEKRAAIEQLDKQGALDWLKQ